MSARAVQEDIASMMTACLLFVLQAARHASVAFLVGSRYANKSIATAPAIVTR